MAPQQQERHEAFLAADAAPAARVEEQTAGRQSSRRPACLHVAAGLSALLLAGLAGAAAVVVYQSGPPPAARALLRPDRTAAQEDLLAADPDPAEILLRQLRQATDTAQKLALHTSVGHILRDQGRYSQAAKHYEAALGLSRTSSELVQAQHMLGLVELHRGRLAEARRHLESAFVLTGQEGDLSVTVFRTLGDVRREMGHIGEALKLYDSAWTLGLKRRDGDGLVLVAAEISEAHARKGEIAKALHWLEKANQQLDANRLDRGRRGDPAVVAKVNSYMAGLQHARGDIARARELYRKALREQAAVLRPSHPDLLATRMGMALAQRDAGDLDGALQAIDAVAKTLLSASPARPSEGPDLARARILKADLLREARRFAEAETEIQEALRLQRLAFGGEDHPEAAVALSSYGSLLHDMGKIQAAHDKYHKALDLNLRTVGKMHPETASTYNSLGTLYEDAGQDDAAEKHFTKCLEIQLHTVGESSPDVANTYNNLATIIFRRGDAGEAADMLRKAIAVLDAAGVPTGNPDRAVYEENLQEVLHPAKKGEEGAAEVEKEEKEERRAERARPAAPSRAAAEREEEEEEDRHAEYEEEGIDEDPVFLMQTRMDMMQKKMDVVMQKVAF